MLSKHEYMRLKKEQSFKDNLNFEYEENEKYKAKSDAFVWGLSTVIIILVCIVCLVSILRM